MSGKIQGATLNKIACWEMRTNPKDLVIFEYSGWLEKSLHDLAVVDGACGIRW